MVVMLVSHILALFLRNDDGVGVPAREVHLCGNESCLELVQRLCKQSGVPALTQYRLSLSLFLSIYIMGRTGGAGSGHLRAAVTSHR
jgi:hypothetical protein